MAGSLMPKRKPEASGSLYARPVATREITPRVVKQRLSYRLSLLIGPGKRFSYEEAARLTGIGLRTMRSYVHGTASPNLARYSRMLRVFGPEVGIELALMLGWEPRAHRQSAPAFTHLRELRDGLAQAITALEKTQAGAQRRRVLKPDG
jgi:hypothetical protein